MYLPAVFINLPTMQETWFDPWVGKIPWRRKWPSTPVFLTGEFHGQRSLTGYSDWVTDIFLDYVYMYICMYIHIWLSVQSSPVQSLSRVQLFVTPWLAPFQVSLSIANSQSWLKLMPLSRWYHPAISSSVVPLSSYSQSLPVSRSFPMSQLFAWGSQSIGVSASASVLQWTPRTDLF